MSAIIAYNNSADLATLSTNVIPHAGYPLSYLQTRSSGDFTRFPVAGAPYIQLAFPTARRPRFIGLFGINAAAIATGMVSVTADYGLGHQTVAVQIYNDAGAKKLPKDVKLIVPPGANSNQWRITPNWSRVGSVNYFQAARLWAATLATDMIEIPEGIDQTWTLGTYDTSTVDESEGGQGYEDKRIVRRQLRGRISVKESDFMFGFADGATSAADVTSMQDAQMTIGKTGEVVVAHRSSSPLWLHRACFRGRMPNGIEIVNQADGYMSVEVSALEEA
jgi:hypothetical protein